MEGLRKAAEDAMAKIAINPFYNSDIFVVFSLRNPVKQLSPCGQHIIAVINSLQKAAGAMKRADFPNIILRQNYDCYTEGVSVVEVNNLLFNQHLADCIEQVHKKFEDPSVLGPFMLDGKTIVNLYGPFQETIDFNPVGHEKIHSTLEVSIKEFIKKNPKKNFSLFQVLVKGVIFSKYCYICLKTVLSSLKTLEHVKNFVDNVSTGIWSPICEKSMELCFEWINDRNEVYNKRCWRSEKLFVIEKVIAIGSPSSVFNRESSVLRCNSSEESSVYRRSLHSAETDHNGNTVKRARLLVASSSESSRADEMSEQDSPSESNNNDSERDAVVTKKEMFEANVTLGVILDEHQEKLQTVIRNDTDNFFCCFCFKFHSSPEHRCQFINEAEKIANEKLGTVLEGVSVITRDVFEKLKEFVEQETKKFEKKETAPQKRSVTSNRLERKRKEPTVSFDSKLMKERRASVEILEVVDESDDDMQLCSPTAHFSSFGRRLRRAASFDTRKISSNSNASSKKTKKRNTQEVHYYPMETIAESLFRRQSRLIAAALSKKFKWPGTQEKMSSLPADESTWTREQYKMDALGYTYAALQEFRPEYLDNPYASSDYSYEDDESDEKDEKEIKD